jgi:hypothetical protein
MAFIITVETISELRTTLAVTSYSVLPLLELLTLFLIR